MRKLPLDNARHLYIILLLRMLSTYSHGSARRCSQLQPLYFQIDCRHVRRLPRPNPNSLQIAVNPKEELVMPPSNVLN
jgi:hypothetical protein